MLASSVESRPHPPSQCHERVEMYSHKTHMTGMLIYQGSYLQAAHQVVYTYYTRALPLSRGSSQWDGVTRGVYICIGSGKILPHDRDADISRLIPPGSTSGTYTHIVLGPCPSGGVPVNGMMG